MEHRFRDWLSCPECGENDGEATVGVLAHQTDVVLECYECGAIAEFRLGRDVPFGNVTPDVLEFDGNGNADDRTTES